MSTWSDGYIHSNGLRIHYYRTGGNKPQIIFNHGSGDDGLCWTRIVKELERDYDVIMTDARGHGKSDIGKRDYSTRQRVTDLVGLIQTLKLDRPVVGGHSLGADTSMHLAANYPHLTRGIFLEDPPIILPGEKFGSAEKAISVEEIGRVMARFMLVFKLMPHFIGAYMARKASPTYPEDEIIPWVNAKKRLSFDFLASMANLQMDLSAPFEVMRKINVPILLFIGDKEKMSIMSRDAAQKAAEANEKLRVVHLEGASHDIRRTRFDGYVSALKRLLTEIYHS